MIEIKTFKFGKFKTNCYLISDSDTNSNIIIDPGESIGKLKEKFSDVKADYILLTHGHFDHIFSADMCREITGAKIVISREDKHLIDDNALNLSSRFLRNKILKPFEPDITVNDGDELPFGSRRIKVISTPGHTKGSVCYILENFIFSGDTLFFRTYGYTDFPTGSSSDLRESLNKLYSLSGHYVVYPGHSKPTILTDEKSNQTGLKCCK